MNPHLDCSSQDVSIVRQPSGEGRAIVEGVPRPILGLLERGLEGVELLPQLKDLLLLSWEVELIRHWTHHDDVAVDQWAVRLRILGHTCNYKCVYT